MGVALISAMNALMREKFRSKVEQTFHSETILTMMLKKLTKEEVNERGGRKPIRLKRSNSFVGGTESLTLPEPNPGSYGYMVPSLRMAYAAGGFSNKVLWQQDIDTIEAGEFRGLKGMVSQQLKDETQDFQFHLENCAFRDGKGKLASAVTAVVTGAAGTATVDPATANYPVSREMIGAKVNFYTSAGTIHDTGASVSTITDVDESTGVVTFDTVPTNAAIDDFLVWSGSWDLMPLGLEALIQNQNLSDFQGIDITGNNNLKSIVFDAAGAGFDIKAINRIKVRVMKREGVKRSTDDFSILTNPVQLNGVKFAAYAVDQIQVSSNRQATKLDLAYDNVTIDGHKINLSNACGERDIWGLRLSALRRYSIFEPNLLDLGGVNGGFLMPRPAGTTYKHEYLYFMAFYGNLFIEKPTSCFRYKNLDKANLG